MIKFNLTGELLAEPRAEQLRRETIRESAERRLASGTSHPTMLAMDEHTVEQYGDPATRIGVYSNGTRYTRLELQVDDQRVEVSAEGHLAERAAKLEPGDRVRITGELRGTHPHHRLVARRITPQIPAS